MDYAINNNPNVSAPPSSKSKLAKTFQKLKKPNKSLSGTAGFCFLNNIPQDKYFKNHGDCCPKVDKRSFSTVDEADSRNRDAMEAFVAKLFATISAVKAAYAELQTAQFPYNVEAVQSSDQAVVDELKALSELKRSFMKKKIDFSPPHLTLLLSEIKEQQSLMKMYEITMNKMEREIQEKGSKISSLETELTEAASYNKSIEKKLNSSGCFSVLDNVGLPGLVPKDFVAVVHFALRSVRSFVKVLIQEMESAKWDIDIAAKAIEPDAVFPKPIYRCFVFESFVCREIFNGFNDPSFSHPNEALPEPGEKRRLFYFNQFKKLKSVSTLHFLKQNPSSALGKFARGKYLKMVHPKMEASISGNLNQRKMVNASEFPETAFFQAFAEMARRVWLLHCLAFSFDGGVGIFQVRKNCRFSEVYMESVTDDVLLSPGGGDVQVAFTVVPGFEIGKTVLQSQVYLSPAQR